MADGRLSSGGVWWRHGRRGGGIINSFLQMKQYRGPSADVQLQNKPNTKPRNRRSRVPGDVTKCYHARCYDALPKCGHREKLIFWSGLKIYVESFEGSHALVLHSIPELFHPSPPPCTSFMLVLEPSTTSSFGSACHLNSCHCHTSHLTY